MGMFYAPITGSAVVASINLWSIQPATDTPVILHAFEMTQSTETGDAAAEGVEINLTRRTGTPTSGAGAAVTEINAHQGESTASAVVLTELTTDWTAGTEQIMAKVGWTIQQPFLWLPPPEGRIVIKDNDVFLVDLVTVVTDAVDFFGWVLWEEI